ncbi:hypothetical protein MRY82_00980 [bacterium]|nr:hypothetical protein [bacterium]
MHFKSKFILSFILSFSLLFNISAEARNIVIWGTEHAHIGDIEGVGCYNAHLEMEEIFKTHINSGMSNTIFAKELVNKEEQSEFFVQIDDEVLRNYALLFVLAYDSNLMLNQYFELSALHGYEAFIEDIKNFLQHAHYILKGAYPQSITPIYTQVSSSFSKDSLPLVLDDFIHIEEDKDADFKNLNQMLSNIQLKGDTLEIREKYSEPLIALIEKIAHVYFDKFIASNGKKYNLNNSQFWMQETSPFRQSFEWLSPDLLFTSEAYNYDEEFDKKHRNKYFYAGNFITNHFREVFMQKKLSQLMLNNPEKNILLWVGSGHDWSLTLSLLHQFILNVSTGNTTLSEKDIESIQILSENAHDEACNTNWVWQSTLGTAEGKNTTLLQWAKNLGMRIPAAYYENIKVYSAQGGLLESFDLSKENLSLQDIESYTKQLLTNNNFEAGTYTIDALTEESSEHKNQFKLTL